MSSQLLCRCMKLDADCKTRHRDIWPALRRSLRVSRRASRPLTSPTFSSSAACDHHTVQPADSHTQPATRQPRPTALFYTNTRAVCSHQCRHVDRPTSSTASASTSVCSEQLTRPQLSSANLTTSSNYHSAPSARVTGARGCQLRRGHSLDTRRSAPHWETPRGAQPVPSCRVGRASKSFSGRFTQPVSSCGRDPKLRPLGVRRGASWSAAPASRPQGAQRRVRRGGSCRANFCSHACSAQTSPLQRVLRDTTNTSAVTAAADTPRIPRLHVLPSDGLSKIRENRFLKPIKSSKSNSHFYLRLPNGYHGDENIPKTSTPHESRSTTPLSMSQTSSCVSDVTCDSISVSKPYSDTSLLNDKSSASFYLSDDESVTSQFRTFNNTAVFFYNRSYHGDTVSNEESGQIGESTPVYSASQRIFSSPLICSDTSFSHLLSDSSLSSSCNNEESVTKSDSAKFWLRMAENVARVGDPAAVAVSAVSATTVDLSHLNCDQISHLKQFAMVRISTALRCYCPHKMFARSCHVTNWIRRFRPNPSLQEGAVFGVCLDVCARHSGHPMPESIRKALEYLRECGLCHVGLFRVPGSKIRVKKLRHLLETVDSSLISFDTFSKFSPHDVADLVKQFYREIPGSLLNHQVCERLCYVTNYVPMCDQLDIVRLVLLLMSDSHRLVLRDLLHLLSEVVGLHDVNRMCASSLAVCLAPNIFSTSTSLSISTGSLSSPSQTAASLSPARRIIAGFSVADDISHQLLHGKLTTDCLALMIRHVDTLFAIPSELCKQPTFTCRIPPCSPSLLDESEFLSVYQQACDKSRLWIAQPYKSCASICLSYKKCGDSHRCSRLWRVSTEVSASVEHVFEVLTRSACAPAAPLTSARLHISPLGSGRDIVHCEPCEAPANTYCASRFCLLRAWRLATSVSMLLQTSVTCPESEACTYGCHGDASHRIGRVISSHYIVETSSGENLCRITHLARIDYLGLSNDWYSSVQGHLYARQMMFLKDSL